MTKPAAKDLSVLALLVLIYFAAGRLGLSLAFVNVSASAVWPPTGIALAALLIFGLRVWPAIFIGAFLVNATTSESITASLLIASGNTLEGVIGAWLVNRYARGVHTFEHPRYSFRFMLLAALLATTVSATVGVTSLGLTDLADWSDAGLIWLTWWLGDATGALIVTPAIVLWATSEFQWGRRWLIERALLLAVTVVVGVLVFGGLLPSRWGDYPLAYAVLPVVVWAAFGFDRREVATVTLVLSALAVWGTLRGAGPFAGYTENESMLLLQGFMGTVAATGLVLAAVVGERRRTARDLRESEEHYRVVAQTATDVIVTIDRQGTIAFINAAAEKLFGYGPAELIGHPLTTLMPERLREAHACAFARYLASGQRNVGWSGVALPGLHKDGREIPLEISFGEFKRDGKHFFTGIVRDVSERRHAEESQRWLATIVESSSDAIISKTLDGTILSWNQAAERMYGYTAAEAVGRTFALLVPPDLHEELQRLLARVRNGEHIENCETRHVRKNGRTLVVALTVSPIRDNTGAVQGASTIARDVTERKRAEARIRYLAQHDALTGLPNRALLRDRIGQAIASARRQQRQVAVLFLDLDGFKHINDSLGHEIGDHVLRMAARRLQACVREDDSVARLGGDEFVISLPRLTDGRDAMPIAEKALAVLREPFRVEQHELHLSGSIGISLYPGDGSDADVLMRAADTAMYHAKESGRNNYQFFTALLNQTARRRLKIANLLHQALAHDEFELHFQPQVDLESGRLAAAEALLRWRHPELGFVDTGEFIKVAEETGVIVPLGEWVLRESCRNLSRWRDAGYRELRLMVNLSPQQLRRPGFVETVASALRESEVPAAALGLEITESMLMMQSDETLAMLRQLADMGIDIAVDDFGVGYSNLAYLQRFPFRTLKIDRSFVSRIGSDPNDTSLVTAIIAIAESLHLNIVGEGVESAEQARFLRAHGCKLAQGYYFGKAMSAKSFGDRLRAGPAAAARASEFAGH